MRNVPSLSLPGESLMRFGQSLGKNADVIYQAVQVENERVDKISAEDAVNKLREKQINLTVGEQDGFLNKKGAAVLDGKLYSDYNTRFDDAANEIGAGLANDRQRELFKSRAGIASLQYKENLLQHVVREKDEFAKEVVKNGVKLEVDSVALNWKDPNAVNASLARAKGLVDAEADRDVWSAQRREAAKQELDTSVHAGVINNALAAGDYQYARQWYDLNKGAIVGQQSAVTKAALEEGGTRDESRRLADEIFAKGKSESAALAEAEKIKDTKIYDATRVRLKQKYNDRTEMQTQARNSVFIEAANILEKTKSIDSIDPGKWALLDVHQKKALRSLLEPENKDEVFLQFEGMGPDARAKLTEADMLQKYKPYLSSSNWDKAVSSWKTARDAANGDANAQLKVKDELTFEQRFAETVTKSGLLTKDKTLGTLKSGEEAQMFAALKAKAADEILAYKRATGKDYIPPEEVKRIIDRNVLQQVFVEGTWSDTKKPVAALTADEISKVFVPLDQIPPDQAVALKKRAAWLKVTTPKDRIERAYGARLRGASDVEINAILTGKD